MADHGACPVPWQDRVDPASPISRVLGRGHSAVPRRRDRPRAAARAGGVPDILMRHRRDAIAAKRFSKRPRHRVGRPPGCRAARPRSRAARRVPVAAPTFDREPRGVTRIEPSTSSTLQKLAVGEWGPALLRPGRPPPRGRHRPVRGDRAIPRASFWPASAAVTESDPIRTVPGGTASCPAAAARMRCAPGITRHPPGGANSVLPGLAGAVRKRGGRVPEEWLVAVAGPGVSSGQSARPSGGVVVRHQSRKLP